MENEYISITNDKKTVLDGAGVEMDLFLIKPHPCLHCGRPVYRKSKYCNDACKAAYHRYAKAKKKEIEIKETIKRFNSFVENNPLIYVEVKKQINYLLESDAEYISMKYIIEVVRMKLRTHIPNEYSPLFARRLLHWKPELLGIMIIKKSKFDKYLEER